MYSSTSCTLRRSTLSCFPGPSDGSISSTTGRLAETEGVGFSSPHLDIFEPRPVLSGGLEAVLGQEAESLGSMSGPELLTHMADGLPTGKTWLRGGESLPSPSCTQGPCKSRSVRKIICRLDADTVSISYNRKVSPALLCSILLSVYLSNICLSCNGQTCTALSKSSLCFIVAMHCLQIVFTQLPMLKGND